MGTVRPCRRAYPDPVPGSRPIGPDLTDHEVVARATGPHQIALGPDHPTLDGLPRIGLALDGDTVSAAQWRPGNVHRGAEKLFESRDYRQILMLVDRHDWLSAFCSEIGVAVGIERALGITVPDRAQHLRVLLCELTRIAHHLAFLAPLPGPLPAPWRRSAWAWRAQILDLVEEATGHRIHPMFTQIGGLRADVPEGWLAHVRDAMAAWAQDGGAQILRTAELDEALHQHYSGVAVLAADAAQGHGASGPVARASGVDLDLRRDDPALPYPQLSVPLRSTGDARARIELLLDEVDTSLDLVRWALDRLAQDSGGPVNVRLPKVVRVPEGRYLTWTENPPGINGYLLVSRNDRTPWRLKLRSAGFGNASALGAALVGTRTADLPAAIASFLLVCGDVDR